MRNVIAIYFNGPTRQERLYLQGARRPMRGLFRFATTAKRVRREKAALSRGCKPHPARSLEPEATGAAIDAASRLNGASLSNHNSSPGPSKAMPFLAVGTSDSADSDKHTIGRWASERQHEPPGGPEFESALNQRIRVGTACDKGVWPFEASLSDRRFNDSAMRHPQGRKRS